MAKKKIGEIFLDNKLITEHDLEEALEHQKESHLPLGKILEEMDVILEEDVAAGLATQFNIPLLKNIIRYKISAEALETMDAGYALAKLVFPLKVDENTLCLAMVNPLDVNLLSELSFRLEMRLSTFISTPTEIKAAIRKHYNLGLDPDTGEKQPTVLHIDAHEIVLRAGEQLLQQHGIKTIKANDGMEGLRIAIELQPDIIVTDIALPRMNGRLLFKRLQEQAETKSIPVIALASELSSKTEYELLETGFFDCIAKPFDKYRYLARVKRALQRT